jgi:hypothetical protein
MKRLLLILLLFPSLLPVRAMDTDSLQVSLLTVLPRSNEIYTIFGHTALRISEPATKTDLVFNWGTFDMNTRYFIYHFVKGKTDYFLSYSDYERFLWSYAMGNANVIEQTLALSPEEKATLWQMIAENIQPQNLEYRYNFLFDNCTTRIRDLIEQSRKEPTIYPEPDRQTTFRHLIHSCTRPYPWVTFGIDLLIGSGADSLISAREELFLPAKLMQALDSESGLVRSSKPVLSASDESPAKAQWWDSPLIIGVLLCLVCALVLVGRKLNKRLFTVLFAGLFLLAGLAGTLVAFTTFFSEHPCTSSNWNVLWLHPLHLIAFAGYCWRKRTRVFVWYHVVNLVLLCALLLGWHWIPQALNTANIPYMLCLALASACYFQLKKQKDII